jgi:hypothetical protein
LRYVHVGGHASRKGIAPQDTSDITWKKLANTLKKLAPKLVDDEQRVLVLSFCYSATGLEKMRKSLKGHFTGCYYFRQPDEIKFAQAMTVWAMFYHRKTIERPHHSILKRINNFFAETAAEKKARLSAATKVKRKPKFVILGFAKI